VSVVEPIRDGVSTVLTQKQNLLLVEDNEVNQLEITHMIDANQFSLTIANNGREAVSIFETNPVSFDIILMDVSMPEMDGHEATRAIRAFEERTKLNRIPIICLTAHALAEDVESARAAGMDDYLSKPISKDKLDAALARHSYCVGEDRRAAMI
jgi:CheY-like chemotaxis protein